METYSQRRKCMAIGIIMLLVGVSSIPSLSAESEQIESTTETNIIIVDNEGDGDYTLIQDAIESASIGDTIIVYSGIYHENVFVNNTLALIGIDAELGTGIDTGKPILDGTGVNDTGITIHADGTLMKGFFIRDYKQHPPFSFPSGIFIISNFTDISNNFIQNIFRGIWIFGNNTSIHENEIHDGTYAITEESCANNKFYQNKLSGDGAGVESWYCQNTEIYENNISSIYSTLNGILLFFSTNTTIRNNLISIVRNDEGIWANHCKNMTISYNIISCSGIGIDLVNSNNNIISHNKLLGQDNFRTIELLSAFFNKIISNDFGTLLISAMLNSLGNIWFNNYYPGWPHGVPRVIPGVFVFGMPYKFIPYVNIDWLPARRPHFP